jgi:hypothetical protein
MATPCHVPMGMSVVPCHKSLKIQLIRSILQQHQQQQQQQQMPFIERQRVSYTITMYNYLDESSLNDERK